MKKLAKAINISQSLLSIHLSGNPGVKDEVVQKLSNAMKATYEKPVN